MPAIIMESLFVTNDVEAALLRGDAARQAIARGYARGIMAYFQAMTTPTATVSPTATPRPPTATPTVTPTATRRPATATPTTAVPPEMERGNASKAQVALTFDAGASSEPTTAILDALKSAGVHSTMFLTGAWIKENPALVRRILTDGHQVANHTMTHPDLLTLSDAEIEQQLSDTDRLFKETTGTQFAPYFRPPFGARDKRVLQAAWRAGYRSVYWTLDSGDWVADATPAGVRDKVLQGTKNGYIVIMHLGSPQTAQVLPDVLRGLQAAGYRLVFVSQIE
jgi:peptidoglycan/xylan/chitin deacetylase (PgdA/CDA1 family)